MYYRARKPLEAYYRNSSRGPPGNDMYKSPPQRKGMVAQHGQAGWTICESLSSFLKFHGVTLPLTYWRFLVGKPPAHTSRQLLMLAWGHLVEEDRCIACYKSHGGYVSNKWHTSKCLQWQWPTILLPRDLRLPRLLGIVHQKGIPYWHQRNGKVKHCN